MIDIMNKTLADKENTIILIPVYNSSLQLDRLLKLLIEEDYKKNILCIDDGSSDNSLSIIEKNQINYISYSVNKGKGYALKKGFNYAIENAYKYALTLDSDLQHDPERIKYFIQTQNQTNADLVLGFRRFNFVNMPFARVLSNYITSFIVSSFCRKTILDSQSGYRLYNLAFFNADEIKSYRYQMETEILFNYINKRAVISHVEIPVIYKDENSNISHLRDIKNFVNVVLKEIFL